MAAIIRLLLRGRDLVLMAVTSPDHIAFLCTTSEVWAVSFQDTVSAKPDGWSLPVAILLGRPFTLTSSESRPTSTPASHMRSMLRVVEISAEGSPSTSRRSARRLGAMRPRSGIRQIRAGTDVALRNAWTGLSPQRTSNSSSSCKLAPYDTPGFPASVPARIGTPALASVGSAANAPIQS